MEINKLDIKIKTNEDNFNISNNNYLKSISNELYILNNKNENIDNRNKAILEDTKKIMHRFYKTNEEARVIESKLSSEKEKINYYNQSIGYKDD